jgi:hypothetical protein
LCSIKTWIKTDIQSYCLEHMNNNVDTWIYVSNFFCIIYVYETFRTICSLLPILKTKTKQKKEYWNIILTSINNNWCIRRLYIVIYIYIYIYVICFVCIYVSNFSANIIAVRNINHAHYSIYFDVDKFL